MALKETVALVAAARLEALEHAVGGDGLAGAGGVGDGHAQAVSGGARDAGDNRVLVAGHVTVDERDVAAVEHAHADQVLQGLLRRVVLGGDHESRGVHVEAMHDAGALLPLQHPQVVVAAVGHKRIGEGVVDMARARVAHEARLLRQDDEVVVLKAYIEVNVGVRGKQAARLAGLLFLDLGDHAVAEQDFLGLRGRRARVDEHGARLNELGAGRARGHALGGGEKRVEAHPVGLGPNEQVHDSRRHARPRGSRRPHGHDPSESRARARRRRRR